jgi:hypothetical protein
MPLGIQPRKPLNYNSLITELTLFGAVLTEN